MAFSLLSLSSSSPLFSSSDSSSLLFRTAINSTNLYRNNTNQNVYSYSDKYSCRLFNHPSYPSMSIGTEASLSGVSDKFLDATSDEIEGDTDDEEEEVYSGGRVGFVETEEDEHEHEHDWGPVLPERWDVLGLGQAMVDFSGMVDDEFLDRLGLEKGTRKVVYHEERGRVLRAMDGCSYKAAAGGSLSNSLVALARLGGQPIGGPALNIAMTGSVGSDPLGGFYRSKLRRANVNFLSAPVKDGTTGTVIVLTTPDAQRTMLAYQGTSSRVHYDSCLAGLVSKTRILIVEGYLFELPDTIKAIRMACEEARRCGALIAITASDVSCIERHYDDFWDIMENYADIVFSNSDEARTFSQFSSKESPISAARPFRPLRMINSATKWSCPNSSTFRHDGRIQSKTPTPL